MDSREQLRQQMIEIGDRYLKRTLGELSRLRELVSMLGPGATDSIVELEHIVHRIHGSGAMFNFDAVSEHARRIEVVAGKRTLDAAHIGELQQHLDALDTVVREAARSRGIEQP